MGEKRAALIASMATVAVLWSHHIASALTLEEARQRCIEAVGVPIVRACMQEMGAFGPGGTNRDSIRAKCIATRSSPRVAACITETLNKANGRANVPLEIGKSKEEVNLDSALPAGFVPPPRTIADIAAVLDTEKPNPVMLAKLKTEADSEPRNGSSASDLAEFYSKRANARSLLGRDKEAVADAETGFRSARNGADVELREQLRKVLGFLQRQVGDLKGSLATFEQQVRETENAIGLLGHPFGARRNMIDTLLLTGDVPRAEAQLRGLQALIVKMRTTGMPRTRAFYSDYGRTWEANFEGGRASLFEARGNYRDAETAFQRAANYHRAWIADTKRLRYHPTEALILQWADTDLLNVARMKARQGRLAEAGVDARAVLLSRLKEQGKYNALTTKYVMGLAGILMEQGRSADAEKLIRSALDIQRTVGVTDDNQYSAQILSQLGAVLTFQSKVQRRRKAYAELDKAIAKWEPQRKEVLELSGSRIFALYASGQIEAGLAAAQELVKREVSRVGERHFDAAAARGTLAQGLALAGQDADAAREFKAAIPILMAAQRENADDDDETVSAARSQRLQAIVEAYIGLLAKIRRRCGRAGLAGGVCPGRCDPRPVCAEGALGLQRPQRGEGSGARRTGAQGAGPRQADQRPARRTEQRAGLECARGERGQRDQGLDRQAARRSRRRCARRLPSASRAMPN